MKVKRKRKPPKLHLPFLLTITTILAAIFSFYYVQETGTGAFAFGQQLTYRGWPFAYVTCAVQCDVNWSNFSYTLLFWAFVIFGGSAAYQFIQKRREKDPN